MSCLSYQSFAFAPLGVVDEIVRRGGNPLPFGLSQYVLMLVD